MRAPLTALLALLLVTAGTAPALAATPAGDGAVPASKQVSSGDASGQEIHDSAAATPPEDPEEDVIGWENGYWYNESVDVDQSDGLNESEREALVARTMARVEEIRRLEFEGTVPVTVITRAEFRNRSLGHNTSAELQRFDNAKFEAMLLVGDTEDSISVQDENRGSSVLGYYSPREEAIVMVADNETTLKISELTLAHELVHALQDQHFNLSRYDARTRDSVNGENGLIEGDASFVEHRYSQLCDGAWEDTCSVPESEGGGGGGELANIGVYLLKFQPYSDGPAFIKYHYERGGWAAVNALYDRAPTSAAQVIHPEKYPEEATGGVDLADKNSSEWTRVRPPGRPDHAELGQAGVMAMLVYPLYHSDGNTQIVPANQWLNYTEGNQVSEFDPLHYDHEYAAGWAGDRMHVYENDANETAYVWRLTFESDDDAAEFVDGYQRVLEYWGAESVGPNTSTIPADARFPGAFHIMLDGDTVTIVHAPTVEQLPAVYADVEVGPGDEATPTTTAPGDETPASPTSPTATPTKSSPGGVSAPGFGPVAALVALLAVAVLARRRR